MTYFQIEDTKWADGLQSGLEEYMMTLQESAYAEEEGEEIEEVETASGIAFCGCDTCYYREILCYLTPRILEGGAEGKVTLTDG
jgi:hypothetical protein